METRDDGEPTVAGDVVYDGAEAEPPKIQVLLNQARDQVNQVTGYVSHFFSEEKQKERAQMAQNTISTLSAIKTGVTTCNAGTTCNADTVDNLLVRFFDGPISGADVQREMHAVDSLTVSETLTDELSDVYEERQRRRDSDYRRSSRRKKHSRKRGSQRRRQKESFDIRDESDDRLNNFGEEPDLDQLLESSSDEENGLKWTESDEASIAKFKESLYKQFEERAKLKESAANSENAILENNEEDQVADVPSVPGVEKAPETEEENETVKEEASAPQAEVPAPSTQVPETRDEPVPETDVATLQLEALKSNETDLGIEGAETQLSEAVLEEEDEPNIAGNLSTVMGIMSADSNLGETPDPPARVLSNHPRDNIIDLSGEDDPTMPNLAYVGAPKKPQMMMMSDYDNIPLSYSTDTDGNTTGGQYGVYEERTDREEAEHFNLVDDDLSEIQMLEHIHLGDGSVHNRHVDEHNIKEEREEPMDRYSYHVSREAPAVGRHSHEALGLSYQPIDLTMYDDSDYHY